MESTTERLQKTREKIAELKERALRHPSQFGRVKSKGSMSKEEKEGFKKWLKRGEQNE